LYLNKQVVGYVEKEKKRSAEFSDLKTKHDSVVLQLETQNHALEKVRAEHESLCVEKDALAEDHSKLATVLAIQSRLVETHRESMARLENEKVDLEGKVEHLISDNQVYAERLKHSNLELARSTRAARAKEDAYKKFRNELEQALASVPVTATTNTPMPTPTPTPTTSYAAATTLVRLKEELKSKSREHTELRHNFCAIAM
jgi:chromosome segregation ATPase